MKNRIIAALLLMLWTASVTRCLAEQYGFLHETPGLECCAHDHEHDAESADGEHQNEPESEPPGHSHSNPCGICHMIEHSGVNLITQAVAAPSPDFLPVFDLILPELNLLPSVESANVADDWQPPPITRLPIGAYLAQTSLPVRGPDVAC